MTFIWKGKSLKTVADVAQAMLAVTSPEEAQEFKAVYALATSPAAENLGYLLGYEDADTRRRLFAWFGVEHPVFGLHEPTADEALRAGMLLGQGKTREEIRREMGWE